MLENVARTATFGVVDKFLRSNGYVAKAFMVNAASFKMCMSRQRLFILGVDPSQVTLLEDPARWAVLIKVRT